MVIQRFATSLAIEFGPATLFFVGALAFNFFTGVALLMASTVLAVIVSLIRDGRVPLFSLIASFFVLLSGAATLATSNPYWVVLEYTLYNFAFAIAICIGYFIHKPALKPLFGTMFHITERGWQVLSVRWGIFFLLSAIGSELAHRLWSYDVWVYCRFLVVIALTIFGFSQFFLARKERLPDASPWGLRK